LAVLVPGERHAWPQPFHLMKVVAAKSTAEEQLGRRDTRQLALVEVAVAVDVEVVEQMLHECIPDGRERLVVDATCRRTRIGRASPNRPKSCPSLGISAWALATCPPAGCARPAPRSTNPRSTDRRFTRAPP